MTPSSSLFQKQLTMAGKGFFLLLCFAVLSVVVAGYTSQKTATFIGAGECTDCGRKDVINFKGVQVRVMCRSRSSGRLYWSKVHGNGEFDQNGKVTFQLPTTLLKEDGSGLRRKCYAHLYSTSKGAPCPTQSHQDLYRVVLTSVHESVHLFGTPTGKFKFSQNVCAQKNWDYPYFGLHKGVPIIITTTPAIPSYSTTPVSPVYVPTPAVPVYVTTPAVPVYVPTPADPVYVPTPADPVYVPTPTTPVYVPTPTTPVYVPTPTTPVYTYVPPSAPVYMPPATPANNMPPGTQVINMPPGTRVVNIPPAAPVYTPPVTTEDDVTNRH